MALSSGFRLGVYEILAKLGEGGMGEVYRARDTRLKRDVAIKVLPEAFARDPDRLARFQREAEMLATLNHPNIAGIYGFEESAPVSGIVLELVDGPTLSDRIAQGAMPLDEALSIARQVADALEAAHASNIVHRDLKPGNIKLTPGGQVKVLDFGLAKAIESVTSSAAALTLSPTVVSPATQAGIVLGTAAYMSPEQARGRAVDQRADVWAFGCVLFEMLTGRSPFGSAETVSDAIAAILTREPDWSALAPETPASIRRLLRRCVEKDVNRRLHHIADARLELDDPAAGEPVVAAERARPRPRWRVALPWAIAAVALGVAAVPVSRRAPASNVAVPGVSRLELNLPSDLELFTSARTVALSPDASRLAFIGVRSGARHVYLRPLDRFDVTALQGTDNASMCFFSADGASIGFVTSSGILKTVSLSDGVVATVANDVSFLNGAAWNADGTIVISRGNTLWTLPRTGGEAKALTTLDVAGHESRHAWPMVLPGGRAMLFGTAANDRWRIDAMDLNTGKRHTVVENGTLPMYTAGRLAFVRDGQVLAAPFDATSVQLTGPAVAFDNIPLLTAFVPLIDVSVSGTVVYSPMVAVNRLVWVSRDGKEEIVNDNRRAYTNPRISPDGQRIVVQAGDLWMQDLARGTFSRLTNGEILTNGFPIWMPDGRVMYRSQAGLRMQGTNGSEDAPRVIPGTTELDYPSALAPDGDTLVFHRSNEVTSFDILSLSLRDPSRISAILKTPAYESGVQLSPDGRWLTYVTNETGRNEVYVTSFPGLGTRQQVSTQGGTQAIWNPNGKELFYRIDDKMMAVEVTTTPVLKLSPPKVLFEARYAYGAGITISNFDISRDGTRFLMVKPESGAGRLNVVLNWFTDRRVAASN